MARAGEIFWWLLNTFLLATASWNLLCISVSSCTINIEYYIIKVYPMKAEVPFSCTTISMNVELRVLCSASNQNLLEVV
jgi:hypothetical protein